MPLHLAVSSLAVLGDVFRRFVLQFAHPSEYLLLPTLLVVATSHFPVSATVVDDRPSGTFDVSVCCSATVVVVRVPAVVVDDEHVHAKGCVGHDRK